MSSSALGLCRVQTYSSKAFLALRHNSAAELVSVLVDPEVACSRRAWLC